MNFCPNCGEPVKEGAKFCPACGYSLAGEQTQETFGEKVKGQVSRMLTDVDGKLQMETAEGLNVTRAELKKAAQSKLSGRYGEWFKTIIYYFLALFVVLLLVGVASARMTVASYSYTLLSPITYLFWLVIFLVLLVFIAFLSFMLQAVLQWCSIFTLRGQRADGVKIFSYFIRNQKNRIVKANILIAIYTFLWSLLFIIPGIVKGASYAMTNYLLEKDPNLSANEAINQSRQIMHGYKLEFLILRYSFYFWGFAMSISGGLAGFYVLPYQSVTEMKFLEILYQNYQEKHSFVETITDAV